MGDHGHGTTGIGARPTAMALRRGMAASPQRERRVTYVQTSPTYSSHAHGASRSSPVAPAGWAGGTGGHGYYTHLIGS